MSTYRQRIRTEVLARLDQLPHANSGPHKSIQRVIDSKNTPVAGFELQTESPESRRKPDTDDTPGSTVKLLSLVIAVHSAKVGALEPFDVLEEMLQEIERRMVTAHEQIEFVQGDITYQDTTGEGSHRGYAAVISYTYTIRTVDGNPTIAAG